jgi:phosphoserine phosphatase RsbU/P
MTSSAAPVSLAPSSYRRLLETLEEEGKERIFLREVVDLLRGALGVDSLAAYLEEAGSFELCVSVGPESFPQQVGPSLEAPFPVRAFTGGLLASPPGFGPEELPESLELLLAAALRLCNYRYRLKQHDFDARYRGVELEALHDVGLAIASTLDLGELTEEILLRAVSLLDARRGALYLLEAEGYRLLSTIGGAARGELPAEPDPVEGDGTLPGAAHLLVVPIEVEGHRRGLLAVGDKESRQGVGPFSTGDRRSLALLANQAALALEQARLHQELVEKERMEREMDLASQIQRGILPRELPTLTGYELTAWTRPARHVGGDYYDILPLSGGRLAFVVADVTGKGVPAALLVATLHSSLRLLVERCDGYEELMHCLNEHLLEFSSSNKFVTLFLAELDPAQGVVRYVNAGHNPGLILRRGGGVEELAATGVPLGLLPRAPYRQRRVELAGGDLLCLYSDGLTEATSPDGEELGLAALVSLLGDLREQPLTEVRSVVERSIRELTVGLPQGDDQTMLLLRRSSS